MKNLRWIMMVLLVFFIVHGAVAQDSSFQDEKAIMLTSTDINGIDHAHDQILLSDLLSTLEQHFDVTFLYKEELIVNRYIDGAEVHIDEKTGKNLSSLLDQLNITFQRIDEQTYVLLGKDFSLQTAQVQEEITGTVTDGQTGETLPGVNILVKGTSTGASTDVNGEYELTVESLQDTLVVSFIGYQTQEVPLQGRTEVDIQLTSEAIMGEEMVVVGYGEQEETNLTGSVSSVSAEELENRNVSTVSQALEGSASGLTFSIGNNGFKPGASKSIDIRGVSSLNGGSPLVIIDGFPGDMDKLNPESIKSISILKDAAASAIYGARGSNGVVVITTKSGRKNKELTVSYSGALSDRSESRLPDQPDSYTFAKILNEIGENGGGRLVKNSTIDRILAYQRGDIDYLKQFMPEGFSPPEEDLKYYQTIPRENNSGRWGQQTNGHANYNWYDEYYGHSLNQKHNISVSGGSNNISYYFDAGYFDQEGILNYGTDNFARYNVTGKLQASITDWFDIRYETRFYRDQSEFFNAKEAYGYDEIFHELPRTMPMQPKYFPHGDYATESKIRWITEAGTDQVTNTENWQILETVFTPAEGWNITGNFAYKIDDTDRTDTEKAVYEEYIDHSLHPNGETVPNSIKQIDSNSNYLSTNLYTSYDWQIGGSHNFYGLIGSQLERNKSKYVSVKKEDLINQDRPALSLATGNPTVGESLGHWATAGFFGRLTYNYNQKYLFEVNSRYDGTSRFKKNQQWGLFPSFSLGWNIDREKFWQSIDKYINSFKIRASWGQLGNQRITPYQDLALIPIISSRLGWLFNHGGNRPSNYTGTPRLVSPSLTWETTTTKNIGFDLGFLNNRLQTSLDIYEKNNENMIGPPRPVPGVIGTSPPSTNNASLRTRGWEASLEWNDNLIDGDFSYHINFNISNHKTIITEYNNPSGIISGYYEGKEIGEIWGYTVNGLFKTQEEVESYLDKVDMSYIFDEWNAGDVKYEDTNNDGAVNEGARSINDHGDLSVIGNTNPKYRFGLNIGGQYKAFDLSFLLVGVGKKDFMPSASSNPYWGIRFNPFISITDQHLDYFRDQPGDKYTGLYEGEKNINRDAYWPKMYGVGSQNSKNREPSTRYLADASYMRVKNIEVGYTLTNGTLLGANFPLEKLRIYLSAQNLFTFTNLIKGIDPVAIQGSLGMAKTNRADRVLSIGMNVTF